MEEEFLKESNYIEGVYDEDSLSQALYAWQYLSATEGINYRCNSKNTQNSNASSKIISR